MMRLLLDTHVLIWWWDERERLSERAIGLIENAENEIFVSSVNGLEMAIKVRIEQLPQMRDKVSNYETSVTNDGFIHLPITAAHAVRAGLMPGDHRDPFDRTLAAQALIEDLTIVTRDRQIATFGCKVLW